MQWPRNMFFPMGGGGGHLNCVVASTCTFLAAFSKARSPLNLRFSIINRSRNCPGSAVLLRTDTHKHLHKNRSCCHGILHYCLLVNLHIYGPYVILKKMFFT